MPVTEAQLSEARALAERCAHDFEFFARTCLKIRTKGGDVEPLILNRAQRFLHERIEDQLRRTRSVRMVVVKGRQIGISTYIQARFYWRLWGARKSLKAFILTHEDPATENLFGIAKRFQDNMPAHLKPVEKAANAKELLFEANDSGYAVATAGGKPVGRSFTIQLCHASEVAFWPNAESHVKSLLTTALANEPGTEGIIESTGEGPSGVFYNYAAAALKRKSDYELTFIPWFWDDGYQEPCPSTFEPSADWLEYARAHSLTWEQLYWAYRKNRESAQATSQDPEKVCAEFKSEYPATFDDAFMASENSFIPGVAVLKARKPEEPIIGRGPIILGVDPARDRDRVGIVDRCGRRVGERISEAWLPEGNTVRLAERIAAVINRICPDAVAMDIGSNGAGVYDLLVEMGHGEIVYPVNFGSGAIGSGPNGDRVYANRRAEMYDLMRDWFETPGGVQIPDTDEMQTDLTAPVWGKNATRYNTANALVLEDKEQIKLRLGHSPDLADALALTFAVPFAQKMTAQRQPSQGRGVRRKRGGY